MFWGDYPSDPSSWFDSMIARKLADEEGYERGTDGEIPAATAASWEDTAAPRPAAPGASLCDGCRERVVRAVDKTYGTPLVLDEVKGRAGQFILTDAAAGVATYWGHTGGNYRKHVCRAGAAA